MNDEWKKTWERNRTNKHERKRVLNAWMWRWTLWPRVFPAVFEPRQVEDLFQRFEQISANQAVQAAETWLYLIPGRRFQVNYRWIIGELLCKPRGVGWLFGLFGTCDCVIFFWAYDICLFWFCDRWRCFVFFCLLFWSWDLVMLCFGCFGFDFVGWW